MHKVAVDPGKTMNLFFISFERADFALMSTCTIYNSYSRCNTLVLWGRWQIDYTSYVRDVCIDHPDTEYPIMFDLIEVFSTKETTLEITTGNNYNY